MKQAVVRIPRTEYDRLHKIARKYALLQRAFTAEFFEEPPIKNRKVILKELRATGRYNEAFLKSFSSGLKESKSFRS